MFTSLRSTLGAALALVASVSLVSSPAFACDSYVFDGAALFGASTVSTINTNVATFNRQTGKEIVVVTVPSLDGSTVATAAEKTFADKQVNGVLFFFAKAEKQDVVVGDRASTTFFPSGSFQTIHDAMRSDFRAGDYDGGITTGVKLVLNTYRGHENSLRTHAYSNAAAPATSNMFGGGMSLIWLALILIAGFLIIRAIFRAISGPRMMPPGYGGPGPGGPGYGGPGYGGGYGMGGGGMGGGGFFSGLLGGLGGAFIGNELFGRHDNGNMMDQSGMGGGNMGTSGDSAGWQSDAGQADMGNAGSGDWGGGGGDFGGGGDSGGGGW